MIAFVLANYGRFIAYGVAALVLLGAAWFHGYTRGEIKLFEYQAKEAQASVVVVTKIRKVDDEAVTKLQHDLSALRVRYAAAKAKPLAAAANVLACPEPQPGVSGLQGNGQSAADRVRDASRMLDDVEGAVLAILAEGDSEIAKYRRLYERDVEAAKQ